MTLPWISQNRKPWCIHRKNLEIWHKTTCPFCAICFLQIPVTNGSISLFEKPQFTNFRHSKAHIRYIYTSTTEVNPPGLLYLFGYQKITFTKRQARVDQGVKVPLRQLKGRQGGRLWSRIKDCMRLFCRVRVRIATIDFRVDRVAQSVRNSSASHVECL